jgi:hypothetical protein
MRLAVALAALLLAPLHALAQCPPQLMPPDLREPCPERYPSWSGELAALGGNMLLSGFSAGVLHRLRGHSFGDAFLRGLAGGAVIYGGKRIATERFGGAGLVGREFAAVGSSMVRNAGEGRGTLEQIVLPVGPARLYLQQSAPRVRVRADLFNLGWLVYAVLEPELRFDAVMSLSAGAPVFLTDNRIIRTDADTAYAHGIAETGIVLLIDVPAYGRDFAREVFSHERVHILQMDQLFMYVTGPAEERALAAVPGLRRIAPYIDVNLSGGLLRLMNGLIPEFLDRPWETEAIFLSR